jgi:carbon monoxide dehydrogenase subunit G
MPTMSFERDVTVAADREAVWTVVTDVDLLARWISLLGDVKVLKEMEHYQTTLHDKIGRFSLTAPLDIRITEQERPRYVVVTMQGEDRQVSSRITVNARLEIEEGSEATGSTVRVSGQYEVSGTVATLGAGTIRKKAARIIEDFFDNMEAHFK